MAADVTPPSLLMVLYSQGRSGLRIVPVTDEAVNIGLGPRTSSYKRQTLTITVTCRVQVLSWAHLGLPPDSTLTLLFITYQILA